MKKASILSLLLLIFASSMFAQKLGKPTLTGKELNEAQHKTLNEGIALHDAKKYAEAIAKYRSIVGECEDCPLAIYELALSLNAKGDKLEAVETAYRGTKYISDALPLLYVLIANNLDDAGKPEDALTIYRDGLKILAGDTKFRSHRASLNYNMGLTLYRQRKYAEARQTLKSAIDDDHGYVSAHYLLSVIFNGTRYKIPAMLAAARLVSLEWNTQRTVNSANLVVDGFKPAEKDPKSGNYTINLDFLGQKDEGEFAMYELMLPTLSAIDKEKDAKKKSPNESYASSLDSIITSLDGDKKLKSTFVGRHYIPFLADMKRSGHLEAFANLTLFIANRNNLEAGGWIDSNDAKIRSFLTWAKAYRPPAK